MKPLTLEEVMLQENALHFKFDFVRADTSPFVVEPDEDNPKTKDRIIQYADEVLTVREECEEHIAPVKLCKSWYEPNVGICRHIYGTCIKCGQSVIGYNDKALTLDGVEMADNIIFPDLEELDHLYEGHDFRLDQEDYERRFNKAAKQLADAKNQEAKIVKRKK